MLKIERARHRVWRVCLLRASGMSITLCPPARSTQSCSLSASDTERCEFIYDLTEALLFAIVNRREVFVSVVDVNRQDDLTFRPAQDLNEANCQREGSHSLKDVLRSAGLLP